MVLERFRSILSPPGCYRWWVALQERELEDQLAAECSRQADEAGRMQTDAARAHRSEVARDASQTIFKREWVRAKVRL
jgi:hypothetical protein